MRNKLSIIALMTSCLLFILASCRTYSDCAKIKNGKFYYITKISKNRVEVSRSDSVQIETDLVTGQVLKGKIYWESDCQYKLRFKSFKEELLSQNRKYLEILITVQILTVEKDFYTSKAVSILEDRKFETVDTFYYSKNYRL